MARRKKLLPPDWMLVHLDGHLADRRRSRAAFERACDDLEQHMQHLNTGERFAEETVILAARLIALRKQLNVDRFRLRILQHQIARVRARQPKA